MFPVLLLLRTHLDKQRLLGRAEVDVALGEGDFDTHPPCAVRGARARGESGQHCRPEKRHSVWSGDDMKRKTHFCGWLVLTFALTGTAEESKIAQSLRQLRGSEDGPELLRPPSRFA